MKSRRTKFVSAPDVLTPIYASMRSWGASFRCWRALPVGQAGLRIRIAGRSGGNIVNASPAADSLPALLVYEAELILVSVRGERRLPYVGFHTGYKKMKLAPDELIRAVCLPRRFSRVFCLHAQSWGTQRAGNFQSVHRGAGPDRGGVVEDVRIAVGSVAPVPLRLVETERLVTGKPMDPPCWLWRRGPRRRKSGRSMIFDQPRDIGRRWRAIWSRSFWKSWVSGRADDMSAVLARWNRLSSEDAAKEILPCCGSKAWADGMAATKAVSGCNHSASCIRRNLA